MSQEPNGPVMLAATAVLKPGPARISRIGPGIQLPRTVPIKTLIVVVVGMALGVITALAIFGGQLRSVMIAGVIGGAIGWFLVNYSPLKGESLTRWIGLEASALRDRRLTIDGERAQAYVGICPLSQLARGKTVIARGHADVAPGSVDERGGVIDDATGRVGLLVELGRKDHEEPTWG